MAITTEKGSRFRSSFELGDKVMADDGNVEMTVVGFAFYHTGCQLHCSWFNSGVHYEVWFYEWRLKGATR